MHFELSFGLRLVTLVAAPWVTTAALAQGATYHVPTPDDPDLAAYATMPLTTVEARIKDDGEVRIKYQLPPELDGADGLRLDLRGTELPSSNSISLNGVSLTPGCIPADGDDASCTVHTTATCSSRANGGLTCVVDYSNLQINMASAESYMQAQGTPADRLQQMLAVAEILQHQAQGVVTISPTLVRRDD